VRTTAWDRARPARIVAYPLREGIGQKNEGRRESQEAWAISDQLE